MKLLRVMQVVFCAVLLACPLIAAQEGADASMEQAKRAYRNGNFQTASAELARVTEQAPERADAFYLLGYARLMLRQYPAALEAFSRAFQIDPTFDPRTIYQRSPTP